MKKIVVLLCAALMTGSLLVGCGNGEPADTNKESQKNEGTAGVEANGFAFAYKGTDIIPNAKMDAIETALGEPTNYFESDSCAFQGKDKVYTYGSVVINTYPENGVDYVYTIQLKDDTVQTKEGIYIGATVEDVKAKYGNPAKDTGIALVYEKGTSTLNFSYENGVVTQIVYYAVVE